MATGPREAAQILILNPNIPNLYESQLGSEFKCSLIVSIQDEFFELLKDFP